MTTEILNQAASIPQDTGLASFASTPTPIDQASLNAQTAAAQIGLTSPEQVSPTPVPMLPEIALDVAILDARVNELFDKIEAILETLRRFYRDLP